MAKARKKKKLAKKQLTTPKVLAPDLKHGPFSHGPKGLKVDGSPTFEEWHYAVYATKATAVYGLWFYGDLMAYGQQHYGEDYAQALDSSDYVDDALRLAEWVARKFPPERRHPELTFSHHKIVAALPPKQADRILETAAEKGLSVRDVTSMLRAEANQETATESGRSSGKNAVSRETETDSKAYTISPSDNGKHVEQEPVDEGKAFVGEVETLCRDIDQVVDRMKALKQSKFSYSIHVDSAVSQVQAARSALWQGRPDHVCPYCNGDGCKPCGKTGRVKLTSFKSAKEAVG